jgi:hypothetical protein
MCGNYGESESVKVREARIEALGRTISLALCTAALLGLGLVSVPVAAQDQNGSTAGAVQDCDTFKSTSVFIPVDSWIYPSVLRLYSLGVLDNVYLGIRPWTWGSLGHILEDAQNNIDGLEPGPSTDEVQRLYDLVHSEFERNSCAAESARFESIYSVVRAISGTPLRDSFHLGSTIINDYGRPYESGLNNYTGASGYAIAGRFALYVRGEFQGVPSATGYSSGLTQQLATVDSTVNPVTGLAFSNQATIPSGPIVAATHGRILEAYVSAQVMNHMISFGKLDEWLGPAQGGSMAYSNNAENVYALHINRIEPLSIPGLSRITGPFRYEFLLGALRGHTLMPNPLYANNPSLQANVTSAGDPWVHLEKISFRPTNNLEFGFERTVIWGGSGHSPATLGNFLRSFFSTASPAPAIKNGRTDPGARFGAFDFSYRIPYLRNWLTLYSDAEAHDDVNPIDAPQHASLAPGLYLSHVPGAPKLDLRAEATYTDPPIRPKEGVDLPDPAGQFEYWEQMEKQGYTNQGQIFGSWIGRQAKGGQAWLTWHLSGNEWIQASMRRQKTAQDFIPGGTTLDDVSLEVVKRLRPDLEINGQFTLEHWRAPIYLSGLQTVTTTNIQLTWFPKNLQSLSATKFIGK